MNVRTELIAAVLFAALYIVSLWQLAETLQPILRCGAC